MNLIRKIIILLIFIISFDIVRGGGHIPKTAEIYIRVAANNSSDEEKIAARPYVCDGTLDDVEIQNALDALPSPGGTVFCAAGSYDCGGRITVPSNCKLIFEIGSTITVSDSHTLDQVANQYTKNTDTISALITNSNHPTVELTTTVASLTDTTNVVLTDAWADYDSGDTNYITICDVTTSNKGDKRLVTAYTAGTKTVTFESAFEFTPANPDIVYIETLGANGKNSNIQIIGVNIDFESPEGASKFDETQSYAGIWLDFADNCKIIDCKVENVVYDCKDNPATARAYGILISDSTDCIVENCETNGAGYEGIGLRGYNQYCQVKDCRGFDNYAHVIQMANWTPTVIGSGSDLTIKNCYTSTASGDNFCSDGDNNCPIKNSIFQNCQGYYVKLMNCGKNLKAINNNVSYLWVTAYDELEKVYLIENTCPGTTTIPGIYCTPGSGTGSLNGLYIINNDVEGVTNHASISIDTIGASGSISVTDIIVEGNTVRPADIANDEVRGCIYLKADDNNSISNFKIINNIFDVGKISDADAICVKFSVVEASSTIDNGIICGNYIRGNDGIGCVGSVANSITNVIISDNYFTCYDYAFAFKDSASIFQGVRISDNDIYTCERVFRGGDDIIFYDNHIITIANADGFWNSSHVPTNFTADRNDIEGAAWDKPIEKTADYTIPKELLYGHTFTNNGDVDSLTLTAATALVGMHFRVGDVENAAGADVILDGNGTEPIGDIGVTATADDDVRQFIELWCYETGVWDIPNYTGTWDGP